MHLFNPALSLRDNYLEGEDIEFAAWQFAGHDHREAYRDSGSSIERSAWLRAERLSSLKTALANGELIALGILIDDPAIDICLIPENLFLAGDISLDGHRSSISGMGRNYVDVQICIAPSQAELRTVEPKTTGRPSHLPLILDAWTALKSEIPNFLDWDKSSQNRQIREKVSELFPGKFPGKTRIGSSTIRRNRSQHRDLFK